MTVPEYEEANDSIAVKYQSISMDGYSGCGKAWGCMYYAVLEKLYNTTISATNTKDDVFWKNDNVYIQEDRWA
jgi:hypothetical protein